MASFVFFLLIHPPALSQCIYGSTSYPSQGCTFTQGTGTDSCVSSNTAMNTQTINQFYLFSDSGVSVLYCGGTNNPGTSTIPMQCAPPLGATIVQAYLEVCGTFLIQSPSIPAPWTLGGEQQLPGSRSGKPTSRIPGMTQGIGRMEKGAGTRPMFFSEVRYNVTSLVSDTTMSYAVGNLTGALKRILGDCLYRPGTRYVRGSGPWVTGFTFGTRETR